MKIEKLKSKFFTGAWLTDVKQYFSKINEIIDSLNSNSVNYKIYRALVKQEETDAPTAIILENTLGGVPIFARDGIGGYTITLPGAFTNNKTFFRCTGVTGQGGSFLTDIIDLNSLRLYTFEFFNDGVGGYSYEENDNLLYNSPLEIIVYD